MALAVLCLIGFIAYWVPTLAANSNRHRNRAAIGMLNLFLGWTFIGWVVALLWADNDNCENLTIEESDMSRNSSIHPGEIL
jgi:hypothetical protein